jgi:predicted ChrR family anti-sigma factor
VKHEQVTDDIQGLAAEHALGALDGAEAQAFQAHLGRCPTCAAEVEAFEAVAGQLAFSLSPALPPPNVRDRLLARIGQLSPLASQPRNPQVWKQWRATPEQSDVVRASEGDWQETGIDGVSAKNLFVDQENQCVTMLVRMNAGTCYPGHLHGDTEQCYVVQGQIQIGDRQFQAGDYIRAARGSIHEDTLTDTGCLLLIISSQHDQLLA